MTTEKQITANRKNSLSSTGPVSIVGKEVVAKNAVKHGILSVKVPVDDIEKGEFELFSSSLEQTLQPINSFESFLVDRIITNAWRLRRVIHVESMLLANQIKEAWGNDTYQDIFSGPSGQSMAILSRYERTLENGFFRALKELKEVQSLR